MPIHAADRADHSELICEVSRECFTARCQLCNLVGGTCFPRRFRHTFVAPPWIVGQRQLGKGLARPVWLARTRSGTRLQRDISFVSRVSKAASSPSSHSGGICLSAWSIISSGKWTTWPSHGSKSSKERTFMYTLGRK